MLWIQPSIIFLFGLLLPTQLGKHYFFPFSYLSGVRIDYLAPTLYVTDFIVIFLIVLNLPHILKIVRSNHIVLFLLFTLLQLSIAQSPSVALYRSVRIAEALLLFLALRRQGSLLPFFMAGIALSSGVELVLSVLQMRSHGSLQGVWYFFGERYLTESMASVAKASFQGTQIIRPYGTFSHPNSLSGFYLLLFVFVLTQPRIKNPVFKTVLLVVAALLVCISFSKTAIAALIICYLAYSIPKLPGCFLCKVSRLIAIPCAGLLFFFWQTDPLTLTKRLELTGQAAFIIKNHVFFGVGLGNYLIFQNKFPIKYPYFFLQPVHNIFLLAAAEIGTILTALIVGFLAWFVFKNRKRGDIVLPFTAVFLTGMLDHYWLTLQQNTLIAVSVAAFILYNNHYGETKKLGD